jgi:ferredoxin-NADP reductase
MAAGKKGSGRSGAANLNTMRTLARDISKKEFRRVYLLYGSESYLRVQFRCRLRDAMADPKDTMNVTVFSGKSINEKEIIRTADTFPFFADRRVVIIKDSGFFKSQHKTGHRQIAEKDQPDNCRQCHNIKRYVLLSKQLPFLLRKGHVILLEQFPVFTFYIHNKKSPFSAVSIV